MSPTAAAVAKIVRPGMKLTEVGVLLHTVVFLWQECSDLSEMNLRKIHSYNQRQTYDSIDYNEYFETT